MAAPRPSNSGRKPLIKNEKFNLEATVIDKPEDPKNMADEQVASQFSSGARRVEAKEDEIKEKGQQFEEQQLQQGITDQMEELNHDEQQHPQHGYIGPNEAEAKIQRDTESDPRREQLLQPSRSTKFRILPAPSDETESKRDLNLELPGE